MTKVPSDDEDRAVKIFALIMSYMGDFPAKDASPAQLAMQIINKGLGHSPALRDEIFIQIVRQLTDNENKKSEMRGWNLLKLISAYFHPSAEFYLGFRSWLYASTHTLNFSTEISSIEKNIAVVGNYGMRQMHATLDEVECLEVRDLFY